MVLEFNQKGLVFWASYLFLFRGADSMSGHGEDHIGFFSTSPNQILCKIPDDEMCQRESMAFQVLNDMSYGDIHPVFPW